MDLEKLEYRLLKEPDQGVRELLSKTVYGTKGGLRLRHRDTFWKLDELISPDYHTLYDGDDLVGVVVYSRRRAIFGQKDLQCLYIRYFSISPKYQNNGVAKYLTEVAVSNYRKSLKEPTVVYAFIEAKNTRSMAVGDYFDPLSLGFFSPIYFSRFFPKSISEVDETESAFRGYYPMDTLMNFQYHRDSNVNVGYCTLRDSEKYAAIRYYKVSWEILEYPGNDWLMKKVLAKVPILNRLVEGDEFNFVAIDAVAFNSEDLLISVFEHALSVSKLSKLFLFADIKDARFDGLRGNKKLGALNKLQKAPKIGIQLFFHDCSEELKKEIQLRPVEIRAFDVT